MKKILILVNHEVVIYNFRKELVSALLQENYQVYISSPYGMRIEKLIRMGCKYIDTPVDRRGTNPLVDLKLIIHYLLMMRKIRPDCILAYAIKPNIYGSLIARVLKIPYMNNITGLGSSLKRKGLLRLGVIWLYRRSLKGSECIFFQNTFNMEFFQRLNIQGKASEKLPGSGVNLMEHCSEEYPDDERIRFLFVGRVMRDKGIEEYVEAAREIQKRYQNTEFHVIGFCEASYQKKMERWHREQRVIYHGMQEDAHSFMKNAHCIVHPSHHEGMANALLEAAACARPVIASRIPGCREIFDEAVSGYGVQVGNSRDLIAKICLFIELPYEKKRAMGLRGREKVEREFDRRVVVERYMQKLSEIEQSYS